MNQPKPVQIRLPFSVPRPKKGQAPPSRVCGMLNDSRYTCPRCNVAYCGLDCFRSEKHGQCSEGFYRETVVNSISADPGAGMEEKKGMMEMLRRFEEDQDGGEGMLAELEDEGEEGNELAKKLAGVNIDEIDSNALFHLLPPEHRDKFLAALKDPESEAAKHLVELAAEEDEGSAMAIPDVMPWWEAPDVPDDEDEGEQYADMPDVVAEEVLAGIHPPSGVGSKLAYNAVAISLAYIHTLLSSRLPSLSPWHRAAQGVSADDLKTDVTALIPFLADQKSTIRYTSAREAYSTVWEIIGTTLDPAPPPDLLIRLLSPLPGLLHPPLDTASSPRLLHLLSDLYRLHSLSRVGAAGKKLAFYVVALRQMGRAEWLKLEREVQGEIGRLERE
ncbi:uncharacterized protein MKK02DRAFT_34020 [Dioszegia hungarica]|uniref:HIT-type domain-containing protein n=1 Tax=Dioszegia hungarica TaxID=4972 RepID=A0AA38LVA4_9TREE|nr:uncharacterized protein MKK02DRAFT_34020 [Dioszegia hungarica]KAI9636945.1 hypothetical protein MKK02DRAFT_34020 [Dioszegia hungarica]